MPSFKCGGCGAMFPKPDIYYHVLKTRGDRQHPGKPISKIGDYTIDLVTQAGDIAAFKMRIAELEAELEAKK